MKYLNNIKTFDDFKPFVIKEDGYWNPNGTKRITLKLIDEMVQFIETTYKPDNIDVIKNNFLSYITTKRGYIFVDENNFEELMEDYNNLIEDLEKNKKVDEDNKNPHEDHVPDTYANIIMYSRDDEKELRARGSFKVGKFWYNQLRLMNVNVCNDIKSYDKKKTFDVIDDIINEDFINLINILILDDDFNEYYQYAKAYINCIYVYDIENNTNIMTMEHPYLKSLFGKENFNDELTKAITSKYSSYFINENSKSFNDLFKLKQIEYVEENYKPNSCFINAIINCFYDSFNAKSSNGTRKFKELTYSRLLNILDIPSNKESDIGLSVCRAIEKFFKSFNLGLDIINSNDVLIYSFRPAKLNNSLSTNIMRIIIDNDQHITLANKNTKSFDQSKTLTNYDINNITDDDYLA